jgi:hypothetical protein
MRINFAGSSSGGQTRLHRLKAQLDSIEQWFWTANYVAWEAEAIAEMLQKPFPASSRFEDGTTVTRPAPAGRRDTEALLRRMEIRRLVEEHDAVPSCRKLQCLFLVAGSKRDM